MARVLRRATVVSVVALITAIPVSGQDATPTPTTVPAPVLAGSWSAIPDAPWGTVFSATAFTGSEVLIVDLPTGRTLGYVPATRDWTRHARAPQRFDHLSPSVWTGTELLIFDRGRPTRNHAYDPATDTWRQLAGSPLREQWVATWADGQVVVGDRKQGMAAYDLATDAWRSLPDIPGGRILDSLDWTGDVALAVTSGNQRSRPWVTMLDPAIDRWTKPHKGPLDGRGWGAEWVGDRLLVVLGPGSRAAAAFDPVTDEWDTIEDFHCPVLTGDAHWTGELLVSADGEHAYDPDTGTCYRLPDPKVWAAFNDDDTRAWATSLWTGEELLWWSGAYGDSETIYTDGIAFRPPSSEGSTSGPGQVSGTAITSARSPFERLWRPFEAADIPFRYRCATEDSFSTVDLADATPTDEASDPLVDAIVHWGGRLGGAMDWHIVSQIDDRVLALSPARGGGFPVEELELTRTISDGPGYETWDFVGGGNCRPEAVLGRGIAGQWRLDPRFPAPGPTTRTLHVLGYVGCNGTEKTGPARIHATDEVMLIAIPMASILPGDACSGLGPTRMTVTLPEPLGQRTLYDAGSLPLRRIGPKTGLGIR